MTKLKSGKYDPYEYAGLQLFVQSTKDSTISARIRLWPRNQDDYPDYQDIVDMEIVFYHNYNQPDEKIVLKEYQLTSYDLWNSIVRYTMEFYELSALKNTVRIDEEDPVSFDIMVTVIISVTFSGKLLSLACLIIFNQGFDFNRF